MAGMALHSREGKEDVTVNWLRSDVQIAMGNDHPDGSPYWDS